MGDVFFGAAHGRLWTPWTRQPRTAHSTPCYTLFALIWSCLLCCSTWASGDTPDTAAKKGALAKKLGLGGVMFWELAQDQFQAKKFALMRAAVKAATT